MPGKPLIEAIAGKQAKGCSKPLLAMQPLFLERGCRLPLDKRKLPGSFDDRVHLQWTSSPSSSRKVFVSVLIARRNARVERRGQPDKSWPKADEGKRETVNRLLPARCGFVAVLSSRLMRFGISHPVSRPVRH
jgi:hypothetical protein